MKLLFWIEKIILVVLSFFIATFLLFTVFEFFPSLPGQVGMNRIYYYAFKERYLLDPTLVVRIKPNFHYEGEFGGDVRGLFTESSFKPVPYRAQYDADGFRNRYGAEKSDVVVLGDSYMEVGTNDADTFAYRLEKTSGLKVANYGMGWYGPFQYLEVFKRFGLRNQPRFALFSIFEGNDMTDILKYLEWQKDGSYYHFNAHHRNFFQRYLVALKDTSKYAGKLMIRRWDPRNANLSLGSRTFHTVFVYGIDPRPYEELIGSFELQKLKEILQNFKETADAHSVVPIILFIPTKAHVYLPYAEMPGWSATEFNARKSHRGYMEAAIKQAAKESGIAWISLTQPFEEAAKQGKFVYYETDTHWNSEGRQIAAEAVSQYLAQNR